MITWDIYINYIRPTTVILLFPFTLLLLFRFLARILSIERNHLDKPFVMVFTAVYLQRRHILFVYESVKILYVGQLYHLSFMIVCITY
jgi:hypothetical protein